MHLKILVVDDERVVARVLASQLQKLGHETAIEVDPRQSLQRIGTEDFDLILTDVVMPGIDGVDLIRAARQAGNTIPFVAVSGRAEVDDVVALLRAGVSDSLSKPTSRVQLRETIQRVIAAEPTPVNASVSAAGVLHRIRHCPLPKGAHALRTVATLLTAPRVDPDAVFDLACSDKHIGASLIALSTTGPWQGHAKPGSPREAAARVGAKAALAQSLLAAQRRFYRLEGPTGQYATQLFLQHAVAGGVAERLAGSSRARVALTCGALSEAMTLRVVAQDFSSSLVDGVPGAVAHAIVDEIHTPATRVIQQRLRLPEALLGPMQALWGHGDDREAAAMRVAWAAVRARISKVHFGHFAQAPEDLHRLGASEERVGQVLREALAELQARLPALGD